MAEEKKQLVPTINKTDILRRSFAFFNGVENRYGFAWRRYGTTVTITNPGGAGFQVRNPPGNSIMVIEKFMAGCSVNLTLAIFLSGAISTDQVGILSPVRLDARQGTAPSSAIATFSSGAFGLPGVGQIAAMNLLANSQQDLISFVDQEIPILPGDTFLMAPAINATYNFTIWWRERLIEEIEKSGNYGRIL